MALPIEEDAGFLETLLAEPKLASAAAGLATHPTAEEVLRLADLDLWGMPMVFRADGDRVGVILNTETDLQSLSTRAVPLFTVEEPLGLALALYIRHLFWCYPLQRVELHTVGGRPSEAILERAAFVFEGVLRGARVLAGARHDVAVYSVLREEYDFGPLAETP